MKSYVHSAVSLLLIYFWTLPMAYSQKKNFTYEQLFQGAVSRVSQPLPVIKNWIDEEHYLEQSKPEETGALLYYKVAARTGKKEPWKEPETDESSVLNTLTSFLTEAINKTLSPDKKWVAYTKADHNLYVTELTSRQERQLTQDGSEQILNGYASWVYYEEILGRSSRYKAFWWSPDSKQLAFMRFDESLVSVFPIYWSEGQQGRLESQRYPKAGTANPKVQIGILQVSQPSSVTWADFSPQQNQYFGSLQWTPRGELWVPWMNRNQDSLVIYSVSLLKGSKQIIYQEHQPTWVDLDELNRIEFVGPGEEFILKSDRDGWENLYLYDRSGKLKNAITTGSFWGTSVLKIDAQKRWLYFRSRHESSLRFDLYRVRLDGTGLTRLSFGAYTHDQVWLSPGGKYFITQYSNINTPPALALAETGGKVIREIASAKGDQFADYFIPRTEISTVLSDDGRFNLPLQITYPQHFDASKKYPVWVSIYGGPNAGTIYDRWRNLSGTYPWWAQEGLVQVVIDNRSSGHFGKIGINDIFRKLGVHEIEDYLTAGRWLRRQPWVDSSKIGITGGSFGGYMTCMALTYGAEVFTHGLALAPVTDWQLYDTHYTERYMDTPQENPEGYSSTSVLNYIPRYRGLLRIVHGTSDDNVHLQNSLQLVNKLEEAKKHFELMLYPGERHGIGGSSALKAQHLRQETFRFCYQYLLQKPLPDLF